MTHALLKLRNISKEFFGVPVLQHVDLDIGRGEAIGLVGENGAGKSTLMRIVSGLLRPDTGEMHLDSQRYAPANVIDSRARGVAIVHQELNLFSNLSVGDNLLLTNYPGFGVGRTWWINRRHMFREATLALDRVGLKVSPYTLTNRLAPGERQLVEIAQALQQNPKLVILDEPTTSLTTPEAERLFAIIKDLNRQGVSAVYVSHNLSDVRRVCKKIIVLRDGEIQASEATGALHLDRLISLMVGRQIEQLFPERMPGKPREPVLDVIGLTQPGVVRNVSFTLHRGEILGLSGLMRSGRTELARMLFGLEPFTSGSVRVLGKSIHPSPTRCIEQGMALLTENRREDGLLLEATVESNTVLASLPRFARRWTAIFRQQAARQGAQAIVQQLAVNCRSTRWQAVRTLSGGNQQKIVLAKWLLTTPKIIILDEPTRGIDIGAKLEIYRLINQLAEQGTAILLISSELEELVGLCDRILVMASGEIRSETLREQFDREELLREAFGKERLA